MNLRKWTVLAASVLSVALLTTGLSFAQDDKEVKLGKLMEDVSATNNKINRVIRTKVTFAKANNGKDIAEEAKKLLELSKKARENEEAFPNAKDVENPKKKWTELMDAMIKATEELAKESEAGNFDPAKKAHTTVKAVCADCHKVFKVEEDF